jgi:hypothetical protein
MGLNGSEEETKETSSSSKNIDIFIFQRVKRIILRSQTSSDKRRP